jgi:hypothetical protein
MMNLWSALWLHLQQSVRFLAELGARGASYELRRTEEYAHQVTK